MATQAAHVAGIGMMTAIGDCAAQTSSSFRAGICQYAESPVYNKRFQSMRLALVPETVLPPLASALQSAAGLTTRRARMLRLATSAVAEATSTLGIKIQPALFLALPETLPRMPTAVDDAFLDHLAIQVDHRFDCAQSRAFALGRAGGMQALAAALEALASGHEHVLVGGLDSYLDLYLLASLDQEDRVLAEGVMDGFCPGEGAGFLLLSRHKTDATRCVVHPPGLAEEPGHRFSAEPYRGDGLSSAVREALRPLGGAKVRTILASLNGENLGAKEWGVAAVRNRANIEEPVRFEHPADCFGDTGAAIGPLLLGLATIGMHKGWLTGPCLAWCSSELAQRGAACVTLTP